jgi:hypothetical protein
MKESSFVNVFAESAHAIYGNKLVVKRRQSLLYELLLDTALELYPKTPKDPKRGYSAFQTDLCIYEKRGEIEFPRIVIEFKTKITTHDVITYSAKAGKHKAIYPGLRYGLLASEIDSIPDRFFIHNENIDFFIAAKQYKSNVQLKKLIRALVDNEIKTARNIEKINFGGAKYDYYRTLVEFRNFSKHQKTARTRH